MQSSKTAATKGSTTAALAFVRFAAKSREPKHDALPDSLLSRTICKAEYHMTVPRRQKRSKTITNRNKNKRTSKKSNMAPLLVTGILTRAFARNTCNEALRSTKNTSSNLPGEKKKRKNVNHLTTHNTAVWRQ